MKFPVVKASIAGGLFAGASTAVAGATLLPTLCVMVGTGAASWACSMLSAYSASLNKHQITVTVKKDISKEHPLRNNYEFKNMRKPPEQLRKEIDDAAFLASMATILVGTAIGVSIGLGVFREDDPLNDINSFHHNKTEIQYAAAPRTEKLSYCL